jgi:hypothetical protein
VKRRALPTLPLLFTLASAPTLAACGIRLTQKTPAGAASTEPDREAPRIEVTAAYAVITAGKALLFDVRGPDSYRQRHAKGAILLDVDDIDRSPADALRRIPSGKQPILYCT